MTSEHYYVAVDDGEHHDAFYESNNLFETLCEYHEAINDRWCQDSFEWVEWGYVSEDGTETENFFEYPNAN